VIGVFASFGLAVIGVAAAIGLLAAVIAALHAVFTTKNQAIDA